MSFGAPKSTEEIRLERIEQWKETPIGDRLIHIHIPKTGGTWLNQQLFDAGIAVYDHASIEYCYDLTAHEPIWRKTNEMDVELKLVTYGIGREGIWENGCKTSIVRNPFDWLVSYYTHRGGGDHDGHKGWDDICTIHNISSFEDFVKKFCDPKMRWWHSWYKRSPFYQMMDAGIDDVSIGVDFVLRQERLAEGTEELFKMLGIKPADWKPRFTWRKRINAGVDRRLDYRSYYTPELREIAEAHFAQELELFGYSFDGMTEDWSLLDVSQHPNRKFNWPKAHSHTDW